MRLSLMIVQMDQRHFVVDILGAIKLIKLAENVK